MRPHNRWFVAAMGGLVAWALLAMATGPGSNPDQCNAKNPTNCPAPTVVCGNGQHVGNPHCAPPTPVTPTASPRPPTATGTATPTPAATATATASPRPSPPSGCCVSEPDAPPLGPTELARPTVVVPVPQPTVLISPPPIIITPTPVRATATPPPIFPPKAGHGGPWGSPPMPGD